MMKKYTNLGTVFAIGTLLVGCGGSSTTSQSGEQEGKPALRAAPPSTSGPLRAPTPQRADTQATAADYEVLVQLLYISYFGRPADTGGLANFSAQMAAMGASIYIEDLNMAYGSSVAVRNLINSFSNSQEAQTLYGSGSTTDFVNAIYKNVLNRTPDSAGLAFWAGAINSGNLSRAQASFSIMTGALKNTSDQGLQDKALIVSKYAYASAFTEAIKTQNQSSLYSGDAAAAQVRKTLASLTSTTTTEAISVLIGSDLSVLQELSKVTNLPVGTLGLANFAACPEDSHGTMTAAFAACGVSGTLRGGTEIYSKQPCTVSFTTNGPVVATIGTSTFSASYPYPGMAMFAKYSEPGTNMSIVSFLVSDSLLTQPSIQVNLTNFTPDYGVSTSVKVKTRAAEYTCTF
jgi:hypothetical protein